MKHRFTTEKKFIYLVQGEADRVKNYLRLADRKQADALFLTYDKPVGGGGGVFAAIFLGRGQKPVTGTGTAAGPLLLLHFLR